jgi:hypothetical protein
MVSLEDKNIGFKVFLGLLIIFIIWIIVSYITIRLNYKPTFDWWTTNNGKKYDKYFSIFSLIAVSYSSVLYYLSSIIIAPLYKLDIDQYRFINAEILPYLIYTDDSGKQNGILTPKSLCETVLLSPGDGDDLFENFFAHTGRVTSDGSRYTINPSETLTYTISTDPLKTKEGNIYYTYKVDTLKDDSTKTGLYPVSPEDWKGLIIEWMGSGWAWVYSDKSKFYSIQSIQDGANYSKWFENGTGRGDNFLARMGITPDTPLVETFINNVFNIDSLELDSNAMLNLLGTKGQNAGGWIGYLQGMSKSSQDSYTNIIRSRLNVPTDAPTPPCTKKDPGKGFAAGMLSLVGGLSSIAFMTGTPAVAATAETAAVAAGPVGWIGIGIITLMAVISASITGTQAAAGTC